MVGSTEVHFKSPPVRSVALIVFFEPLLGLQVSHLSGLREAWRSDYPNSAELPPLRPINRDGDESTYLPIGGSWPVPHVMLTDASDSGVAFQGDRFVRSWSFSEEEGSYPGFEELRADMLARFDEFSSIVERELGQRPRPTGSTCDYTNKLPNLGPAALVGGFTTKWRTVPEDADAPLSYAGLHLHFAGGRDGCSVHLTLDWEGEERSTLNLDASYTLQEGDDFALGGLDVAHDALIERFLEFTSADMQESWGRTS